MNGQNPNNQINGQGGQNIANGVNPSVLGSVGPTPAVNQTPQPQVTPNANTVGQNVGTTLGTAQPVNPNPTPTPDGEKYQVGDVVSFNYLYKNSYAEGKVSSIIHSGTITRVIDGRPAPYLINRGSGWLSNDLILNALTEDFTIGSKVKTIKQGNGSSLGTSNTAKSGIRGVITRIIPGAKYPYLVSTTVPMGWYQKDALEKV